MDDMILLDITTASPFLGRSQTQIRGVQTLSPCRRTQADNKIDKCLRVKRCLHPLPPSQNPPHPKGKKTSFRNILPVPLILIQ
ncbi:uncharacterized protein LOC117475740 isoform X9 [Trematomus bernacchii]|uniref:uncharacterized protein LOC117475740 isoform X9 n=1 Tax=Trematomus bernacchii TaxID=40690 RepID=UPI001469C550|nr:uncharacterized protein LOC117475740 isoform X9 [Trematomus bernacchii]